MLTSILAFLNGKFWFFVRFIIMSHSEILVLQSFCSFVSNYKVLIPNMIAIFAGCTYNQFILFHFFYFSFLEFLYFLLTIILLFFHILYFCNYFITIWALIYIVRIISQFYILLKVKMLIILIKLQWELKFINMLPNSYEANNLSDQ